MNDIRLTENQRNLLDMLSTGMSYKMIAKKSCISHQTVKNGVHNLSERLGMNTIQMIVWWVTEGKSLYG